MSQTMETNMLDLIYLGLKKIVFSAHKSFATVPLYSALSTSVHVPGKNVQKQVNHQKWDQKRQNRLILIVPTGKRREQKHFWFLRFQGSL